VLNIFSKKNFRKKNREIVERFFGPIKIRKILSIFSTGEQNRRFGHGKYGETAKR